MSPYPYTNTVDKMPSKSAQWVYTFNKSTEGQLSSLMIFGVECDHLSQLCWRGGGILHHFHFLTFNVAQD